MATKKQRRRRSKDRRHEWEYVYVDDEGREVEVDEPEEAPARKSSQKSSAKAPARSAKAKRERKIDPPSWRRSARRALIFGPLAFVFFYLTMKTKSYGRAIESAVIITAVLVPFTYLMDTLMYRAFRKRLERAGTAQPKRR